MSGDGCSDQCIPENKCGDKYVDNDGNDDDITTEEDNEYCDEGSYCDDEATDPCISDIQCRNM